MLSLEELFCCVDDFCQQFEPLWQQQLLSNGLYHRQRERRLCRSEIMRILIAFHQSSYGNFKAFYTEKVLAYWHLELPGLVSYQRFIEWMPSVLLPLCAYVRFQFRAPAQESAFSTPLASKSVTIAELVNTRYLKVEPQEAKPRFYWFFGFKLDLVVNDKGELLHFTLTPGNTDDRQPVPKLLQRLMGRVFADKGYISQTLAQHYLLQTVGIQLITKLPRNMKNRLMPMVDKVLLRKRAIIESIIDQLKNISQIEHSRHRTPVNFLVNLVCGLIAYCHQPQKPSLNLEPTLVPFA